ncbi:5709_t:CDS:2 [Paraglomus occultum]|uniref:5709_t:CDS:1 n=1 Tax=Paraglomus occultum TaxID=144539 RepID=A0A9N9CTM8_9GLOM|nr:5709_t:CDS:2 [Paraglomus occultum]
MRKKLVFWVKHPRHTDAVKVLMPYDADVADTKKVVKSELAPAIDKESLGQVLLLSTRAGRLSPDTKIRRLAGKEKTLIVFVDNVESRLYLKTLTADQVPIQVNNPLCLKSNEAYIAVTRILTGDYAQQDINILKKSLCESSIESWSSRYSYNFREGK